MAASATTMPAMVGIVAALTPSAIARGLPDPMLAITSKTCIIPVTVPSNPNIGSKAMNVVIMVSPLLIEQSISEISCVRR